MALAGKAFWTQATLSPVLPVSSSELAQGWGQTAPSICLVNTVKRKALLQPQRKIAQARIALSPHTEKALFLDSWGGGNESEKREA